MFIVNFIYLYNYFINYSVFDKDKDKKQYVEMLNVKNDILPNKFVY